MSMMKTLSMVFTICGVFVLLIYGYVLLSFIHATTAIWALWVLSIMVSLASSLCGIWARDEYFREQFEKVLKNAGGDNLR